MENQIKQPKQPKQPEMPKVTEPKPAPASTSAPKPKTPTPTTPKFNEAKQASKLFKMDLNKPKLDDNFYRNSFKDGYKLNKNKSKAGLGLGRLHYLVDSYGVWDDNSDYSQAYLTHVNPNDFIKGTLTDDDKYTNEEIKNIQDLDLDKINSVNTTPFLHVNFDNNEVVGHEGRHRLASFAKAGVNRVPVVVVDKSPSFKKGNATTRQGGLKIRGQLFDDNKRAKDFVLDEDMIPINYKNLKTLIERYGDNFDDEQQQ